MRSLVWLALWVSGAIILSGQASWANEDLESEIAEAQRSGTEAAFNRPEIREEQIENTHGEALEERQADIPQLSEIEQPLAEAKWLTQVSPPPTAGKEKVAQITAVQLKPTDKGLEVILETAGEFPEVLTSSSENSLITDIPNAQLRLPEGREFRQDNPTNTITAVAVTNLDAKTIRVTVTGKAGVPAAEVSQSPQALILSVAAPPASAPQPTPTPTAPPAPAPESPAPAPPPAVPEQKPEPQAEQEEPLELTVTAEEEAGGYNVPDATTATKTDTPLRDIPQSIQVIPRQVLEDQGATSAFGLRDVLRNVSGVQPAFTGGNTVTERSIIRGFVQGSTFQDGFRSGDELLRDSTNIERIEVLKGPASVLYGDVQPGGIINIAASLWMTYEIQEGNLKGLGLGLGLFYVGERQGDLDNSFRVPDFLRTDASIFYRRDNWRAGINIKNLFDVDYIDVSQTRSRVNVGEPLTIVGSFSIEF